MERHPFLTVVGAEAVALVLCVAGWNAWVYRDAILDRAVRLVRMT